MNLNAINKALKVTKTAAGFIFNQAPKYGFELLDFQNKNQFLIFFYPSSLSLSLSTAKTLSMDNTITNLYIRSISIPFPSFEYEGLGAQKYISKLNYPEEVSITFIETELGIVKKYLASWFDDIVISDQKDPKKRFVFRDNQEMSKKDAMVMSQTRLGIPAPGWINLKGLKLKNIEDFNFDHDSGEFMTITASFSVEKVKFDESILKQITNLL